VSILIWLCTVWKGTHVCHCRLMLCNRLWTSWSSHYKLHCTCDYYIVQVAVLETALSVLKWVQMINLFWRWGSERGYCWKTFSCAVCRTVKYYHLVRWLKCRQRLFSLTADISQSGRCVSSERVKVEIQVCFLSIYVLVLDCGAAQLK
jgi:hypothetical protein